MSGLSMNALEGCPSRTARRRHQALSEYCRVCGTPGRRTLRPSLAEIVAERRKRAAVLDGVA